jgi:hypothetical protein
MFAEQIPPELAGTLERGNENIVVTSESRARATAERYARMRARTEALLKGKGESSIPKQLSSDLDGSLHRGDENIVVISESKAETLKRRLAEATERLEERHAHLSAAPKDGAAAQEPLPTKPSSWWRPFVFGGALIPKADASLALRIILNELRITVDERILDFQSDQIVQSTFCQTLQQLTDSDLGWRTLVQIHERTQARERLRADH